MKTLMPTTAIRTIRLPLFAVALAAILAVPHAVAQNYPSGPLRIVVPFVPGGGTDILSRLIAAKLSEAWKQPVVVDNRPGAGGTVGTGLVAKATADGHAMVIMPAGYAAHGSLYKSLPYNPSRDLAIHVSGHDDLMVYLAKCCNPIRGEEITGFISRGKGIAVHSRDCPNVQSLLYDADRRIDVEWAGPKRGLYPVKLTLHTADRQGLLADVTSVISGGQSNIQTLETRPADNGAIIEVTLDIIDLDHLETIMGQLRKIDGLYEIERIMAR